MFSDKFWHATRVAHGTPYVRQQALIASNKSTRNNQKLGNGSKNLWRQRKNKMFKMRNSFLLHMSVIRKCIDTYILLVDDHDAVANSYRPSTNKLVSTHHRAGLSYSRSSFTGNTLRDDTHLTALKIVQFSRPPTPLVQLRPIFFYPFNLGRPISNENPSLSKWSLIS